MKNIQVGIFDNKQLNTKRGKGKYKTLKFAHINLCNEGATGIPGLGSLSISYPNLYANVFSDTSKGIPQEFNYANEPYTFVYCGNNDNVICGYVYNTKDFNEQMVTAVNKKSQVTINADDLELKYHSFVCIDTNTNVLNYLYNHNIQNVDDLMQEFIKQKSGMLCQIIPLATESIEKDIDKALKLGKLTFTLDNNLSAETNATFCGALDWGDIALYKVDITLTPTHESAKRIARDKNLMLKAKKPKLEIYTEDGDRRIINFLQDAFSLQVPFGTKINMQNKDEIFCIMREKLKETLTKASLRLQ